MADKPEISKTSRLIAEAIIIFVMAAIAITIVLALFFSLAAWYRHLFY